MSTPGECLKPGERFGPVRIFSAAEIMAEELPPVRWVVPDILPEGITLLAGKPKMGKSWMGLDLSIAIATGGVALGTKRVEQGEVLGLFLEDKSTRRIQNRTGKLLAGRPAPPKLHITNEWPRLDEGGADLLDAWVAIHPDVRLVIVDTLAMLKPRANGRCTQYDEDRDAVSPLAPIASEHNVAILLVHHLREAESDDPLDMIHGSAGLTGGVDGALVLKRKRGQADAYLHVDGRDIENPTELALKFDQNAATWAIVGDAEEYRLSEQRRAIIRVLENADESLSPKDITEILNAKGVNISYGAVRELLSQMVKDGQGKNVGRGQYVLPDSPQNSPDNADILTNGRGDVSLSRMSGHFRKESPADGGGVE
jgi:AAA domain/Ferric uptake regulator family